MTTRLVKGAAGALAVLALTCAAPSCGPPPLDDPAGFGLEGPTTVTAEEPAPAVGVSDDQIGLSKASVFDTPEPAWAKPEAADPGDKPVVARLFPDAPPVIPHRISDLGPITQKDHPCMDCHDGGGGKAIPASHKTDLRRAPDKVAGELVGARRVCTSCHVEQTDAEALVPLEAAR